MIKKDSFFIIQSVWQRIVLMVLGLVVVSGLFFLQGCASRPVSSQARQRPPMQKTDASVQAGNRPQMPLTGKTFSENPKAVEQKPSAPSAAGAVRGFSPESARTVSGFVQQINLRDQDLGSWKDLELPLLHSLEYINAHNQTASVLRQPGLSLTWEQLAISVSELIALLPALDKNPELLSERFVWYRLAPEPLMTGYYAPAIDASLTPRPGYKYPIYGTPPNLEKMDLGAFHPRWRGQKLYYRTEGDKALPYFDRRAIDIEGALKGKGLEIAWAKHPWDIYHLQVQGSGFLRLPDGGSRYILYAGQNGRSFQSTARHMLKTGQIARDQLDRDGIRKALDRAGADGKMDLLAYNPSYVFFKLADIPPEGSIGRPLTGMVSLATDPTVLPLGSIVPFSVELPTEPGGPRKRIYGFGLAQDTGGVIKGHRIDYYCGIGDQKEYMAFRIKNPVVTYMVVSKRVLGKK